MHEVRRSTTLEVGAGTVAASTHGCQETVITRSVWRTAGCTKLGEPSEKRGSRRTAAASVVGAAGHLP